MIQTKKVQYSKSSETIASFKNKVRKVNGHREPPKNFHPCNSLNKGRSSDFFLR